MEPKIRFKGFEGEWKTSTIGEIAPLSGGYAFQSNRFSSVGIPIVRISNILETGIVGGDFAKYTTFNGDAEFRLYDGDAVIAMSGATTGKVAVVQTQRFLYQNQRVGKFTKTDKVNYDFLTTIVKSHKFRANLSCLLTSSAQPNASSRDIDSITQSIPLDKDEQKTIGKYFTSLDSQISASTSRLASLKQMKAASLQAMFPQEGETVPKVRFKGFEGKWKTCPLSSIATMHARIGWQNLRKDEFMSNGDYYLITGTDFNDGKISFETCHYIDKERYDQDKNIQLEIDSILITKDGTLGKVAFVDSLDKPATLNAGVFNVRTKDKEIYPKYLFQYLKAPYLMDYVDKNATGGTIKHLNQNMLVNFPVQHPSYKEQEKIGDYLFNLDLQITLQTQRLEKLKQIKSACLDKMFV